MHVEIFSSSEALARYALHEIMVAADAAIRLKGSYSLVLSGGGTPEPLYRLFAARPFRDLIPWQHIHLFWGDERCVPPDQPGNSYRQARDLFINDVSIPPENVHRAKGELSPEEAAEDYRQQLTEFDDTLPRFDFVLLGLGSDGHTASLFPGKVPLDAAVYSVLPVTADYDGRPANRITMTPPVFNNAKNVLFLVTGEKKAKAVATVLHGPKDPKNWPAQSIDPPNGRVTWLLDQPAASLL